MAPRHRLEQVQVHHDGTATVGHLVEAIGVPLTEVGALLAGSVAVSPAHRPPAGVAAQLRAAHPPAPPACLEATLEAFRCPVY